jgi:hypothetical protein
MKARGDEIGFVMGADDDADFHLSQRHACALSAGTS